jgi:CubicO group peptidase (beta-lactamase class C family)
LLPSGSIRADLVVLVLRGTGRLAGRAARRHESVGVQDPAVTPCSRSWGGFDHLLTQVPLRPVPLGTAQITVADGTQPNDVTLLPVNGQASGGAISTLGDMAIWAKALGAGQLLTPQLQTERTQYGAESGYGLGLQRTPSGLVGHDGAVPGFQSSVYFHPPTGTSIVVLTNLLLAPNTYFPEALPAERITQLVQQAVIEG